MTQRNKKPLIVVRDVKKHFPILRGGLIKRKAGVTKAVDGVSFEINRGETLGLVGESGCGKSTLGETILRLHRPTDGKIYFDSMDLSTLKDSELRIIRRRMQIIFQDPYASLNPYFNVEAIVGEPLEIAGLLNARERRERVREYLELVGLTPSILPRYPHEFSGGQRQRIGIARAIILDPDFVICDEPISALDVSIQAQIVNLLRDLQDSLDLTYLFISHDLSMVRHISNSIAVMYLGKIVELAEEVELFNHPMHPYTVALLSAVPIPDPIAEAHREKTIIKGDVPDPSNPPKGCNFSTRCPKAMDICFSKEPNYTEYERSHYCACHLYD